MKFLFILRDLLLRFQAVMGATAKEPEPITTETTIKVKEEKNKTSESNKEQTTTLNVKKENDDEVDPITDMIDQTENPTTLILDGEMDIDIPPISKDDEDVVMEKLDPSSLSMTSDGIIQPIPQYPASSGAPNTEGEGSNSIVDNFMSNFGQGESGIISQNEAGSNNINGSGVGGSNSLDNDLNASSIDFGSNIMGEDADGINFDDLQGFNPNDFMTTGSSAGTSIPNITTAGIVGLPDTSTSMDSTGPISGIGGASTSSQTQVQMPSSTVGSVPFTGDISQQADQPQNQQDGNQQQQGQELGDSNDLLYGLSLDNFDNLNF